MKLARWSGARQLDGMAREPRLQWEGASYQIMARGNARARIFESDADHLLLVETLGCGVATALVLRWRWSPGMGVGAVIASALRSAVTPSIGNAA